MLDVRQLRTDLDGTKAALARKGGDPSVLDEAAALDAQVRELSARRDEVRSRIKTVSKEVGAARRAGDTDKAEALAAESRALGDEERTLDADTDAVEAKLRDILLETPNTPADDAPDGLRPEDNVVVRTANEAQYEEHQRVPHWDVGTQLGILDLERGAKLSGSMFVLFRREGAALVRALVQLALDRNADAFEEIRPPSLVRTETMVSTGHLPKFADEAYHMERDDLWAVPTAEVPLTSLARDEFLDEVDLPMRLMAYTPCFRREAGSAGRDTRGLLRVHEFDKVEILAYATEAQSPAMHQELVDRATGTLDALGLAYRVVDLCAGDLSFSAKRCFDIEVYAPGCDLWLEASSVSWFGDFQARRANIRYRPTEGGTSIVAHTLNGSALAVPRVWAALVETYRRPDGSVRIPEVLRPYMRGIEAIGPR